MDRNINTLRDLIKANALKARTLRQQARETSGAARHNLQLQANRPAPQTRRMLMAYGLLRGKTPEQIESPNTVNPYPYFAWNSTDICEKYYWAEPRKEQTPEEYEAEKVAFLARAKEQLLAWEKITWLNNLTAKAEAKLAS